MSKRATGLIGLLFVFPLPLMAEQIDLTSISLEELLQINVASYLEPDVHKQPASVTIISGEQLRLSGSRILTHALTLYVPGYFFVDDQDDMIAGFRGLAPDNNAKVMVLVNGINMNVDWFWGANDALINAINFDWIDHVEVIRGPGSVTLGQGALLGVVNIVTKAKSFSGQRTTIRAGKDDYYHLSYENAHQFKNYAGYLYLATSDYGGQKMDESGYLLHFHSGIDGGNIAAHNPSLNKTRSTMILGSLAHHASNITLNVLYASQRKDLYNFWFDRDRFEERLLSLDVKHSAALNKTSSLDSSLYYARDNFSLFTNKGRRTGGTREDRMGIKTVLSLDTFLSAENKLAVGVDFRHIASGKNNHKDDNFITNTLNSFTEETFALSNELRTWVNNNTTNEWGIFAEDFYQFNESYTLFGALRYDDHPGWGNHLSSRLGLLFMPNEDNNIRLSYQNGFRGAVGLNYSGGHKRDGFLDEGHFDRVSDAGFGQENPSPVKPEKIDSYEFEWEYRHSAELTLHNVLFYNEIDNVIDVGTFLPPNWPDANPPLPAIDDVPSGDGWGGFWYYKNNQGSVKTAGIEASLTFKTEQLNITFSHSFVTILTADKEQTFGSMYVTSSKHAKAFPENISRLNTFYRFNDKTKIALNYLYYYHWYSPRDIKSSANHLMNLTIEHKLVDRLILSTQVINLLNQDKLYPMNNVPGDASIDDGTPSLEGRTFWLGLEYNF